MNSSFVEMKEPSMARKSTQALLANTSDDILSSDFKMQPKATLLKRIKTELKATVKAMDDLVKELYTQALAHAKAHGDITIMDALIKELPQGYLNSGFRQSMYRNSPLRFIEDGPDKGKLRMMKQGEPGYRSFNIEAAAQEEMVQRRTNANAGERFFGIGEAVKLVLSLPKRVQSAEERGSLIQGDKKKILDLATVVQRAVNTMDIKHTKVIKVADEAEEANRKAARGSKLIARNRKPRPSRKVVEAQPEVKAA
jgi:hypothetical protein